jgi:hypothetical protein
LAARRGLVHEHCGFGAGRRLAIPGRCAIPGSGDCSLPDVDRVLRHGDPFQPRAWPRARPALRQSAPE